MIANEIALTASFKDNVQYNLYGKKAEPNPDKCAWHVTRNLHTDDLEVGTKVMEATAAQSKAEENCYHFSVDWHASEADNLNQEKAIAAADAVVAKLGLADNQAMYFWHTDADHPHLHIVVNRATQHDDGVVRAHDMWKSKERLENAVYEVAQEMGFEQVQGRHNSKNFEPDRDKGAPQNKRDMVHTEELVPWVKEDVKDRFRGVYQEASNWKELSSGLDAEGLSLRQKGQGLIVHDGEKFAKFSQMGKDVRLKGMEQAYGQSYADHHEEMEQAEEQELEELKDWTKEPEEKFEEIDQPENIEKLNQLMSVMGDLEKFEKSQKVKKASMMLASSQKKANRQEWLMGKAEDLMAYHEQSFSDIFTEIISDPEEAKQTIEALRNEKQLKKALKSGRRKHPKWRKVIEAALKRNRQVASKKQKDKEAKQKAQLIDNRIFYRMQKIREAQNRLAERKSQLLSANNALINKEQDFVKAKSKNARLNQLKDMAARDITQKMIFSSELDWKEKKVLLAQWEVANGKEPEKKHEKSRGKGRERDDGWER